MRVFARSLAFAAGGLVGGIVVLLMLRWMHPPGGLSINWPAFGQDHPPTATTLTVFALAMSAGLGAVAWLGFEAGRACVARFPRLRETGGKVAILAGSLALYVLLGVLLGILSNLPGASDTFLPVGYVLLAFLFAVPLAHGVLVGCAERPNAVISGVTALVYGPLAGVLFGLSFAYVFVAVYQPQPCLGCRISFPGDFVAVVITVILIGIGLGLGIVTACAEALGLALAPATRPASTST